MIIGAGPTGLCAGHRFSQLGYDDWVILEATDAVGGLARSVTDDAGFTYDIGGHVLFSHYRRYDELVERLLGDAYTEIRREAWVWMQRRYLPYPFQNNFRYLEPTTVYECLSGLIAAQHEQRQPTTFRQWIDVVFGAGIAQHFMVPYNHKVWATPLELMHHGWIADRVAVVDVDAVLRDVILGEDRTRWGCNSTFRYPRRGGTGFLWNRLAESLEDHLVRRCPVVAIDPAAGEATTADGRRWSYDALLSTMPLDELIRCLGTRRTVPAGVRRAAARLEWTSTHVVGVAVDRPAGTTRTWVYYPEPSVPFHRLTYLSNYSPQLAGRAGQTLLLTETSASRYKPEDPSTIVDRVLGGLRRVGALHRHDHVANVWHHVAIRSYPVPTLERDAALAVIESWLADLGIASRGRFGAWRYEIGNMDHSCMQGVEWANRLVTGAEETVWTPCA